MLKLPMYEVVIGEGLGLEIVINKIKVVYENIFVLYFDF